MSAEDQVAKKATCTAQGGEKATSSPQTLLLHHLLQEDLDGSEPVSRWKF